MSEMLYIQNLQCTQDPCGIQYAHTNTENTLRNILTLGWQFWTNDRNACAENNFLLLDQCPLRVTVDFQIQCSSVSNGSQNNVSVESSSIVLISKNQTILPFIIFAAVYTIHILTR